MILMDIISPLSAFTAAVAILLSVVYYFIKNRDILPGPIGVPYFGQYPFLTDEKCHLQLQEFGKKYGDLYSFTFAGKLFINLGSPKAMRELHVNKSDCFAERVTSDFNVLNYTLKDGIIMANGEAWKLLRKFFVQSFKDYGLKIRDNTTESLYDSAASCVEDFRAQKGKPFNALEVITVRCTKIMTKIVFGQNAVSEEKVVKIIEAFLQSLGIMTSTRLLLMGPFGRLLFKILPVFRKALDQHTVMQSLIMEAVKSVEASLDENHTTCVVEDFYKERNTRKRKNDPSWRYFSDTALVSSLAQVIGDGIETTTYFICCFLNALVEHPDEQDKIYTELMEVVGPNRLPTVEDKSKLSYTNAFINEVIRASYFFVLFPSLECTKETTVRGYRIPKGSVTVLNIWQAHHDPGTYENPDKFDPSRYIASPGKPRAELPVQFGVGKRACSGEAFVMTQVFLFLTSTVKNFVITKSQKSSPSFLLTGNLELILHPRAEK